MVLVWFLYAVGIVLVLRWYGSGIDWYGLGIVWVWFWYGVGIVSVFGWHDLVLFCYGV